MSALRCLLSADNTLKNDFFVVFKLPSAGASQTALVFVRDPTVCLHTQCLEVGTVVGL